MYTGEKQHKERRKWPKYEPDLFTREEISEYPWVFRSSDRSVYIFQAAGMVGVLELKGFVESESRRGLFHYVIVPLSVRNGKDIVGVGKCACESANFYGRQCKHMLHMRNVYRKNREEIDGLLRG